MIAHPTIEQCEAAGRGPDNGPDKRFDEGGLPNMPEERARFEAYMRGHCWRAVFDPATNSYDDMPARICYGVWRDRGALATAQQASDAQDAAPDFVDGRCTTCGQVWGGAL